MWGEANLLPKREKEIDRIGKGKTRTLSYEIGPDNREKTQKRQKIQ